jgi:hypothetical protein
MTEIKQLQTIALDCKGNAIGRGSIQSRPICVEKNPLSLTTGPGL